MELTRAHKSGIYTDAKRGPETEKLILAQPFYNKILEKPIASYRGGKTKFSVTQFNKFAREIIQEDKKCLNLYPQTRCEIEFRLIKAAEAHAIHVWGDVTGYLVNYEYTCCGYTYAIKAVIAGVPHVS